MSDFNEQIIAEFRANGGRVETYGFGSSLVLLHTVGAKTGAARVSPVMAIAEDGGTWLIAASKAGAPDNPAWFANLLAQPDVAIETGTATVDVTARSLEGDDYEASWQKFEQRSPAFAGYKEKAGGRVIPVVRLSPR